MRLADFIAANSERILAEWVTFAGTIDAAEQMDLPQLRDHAGGMLTAIVADLREPQTPGEQTAKAQGGSSGLATPGDTAAELHGSTRDKSGFSIGEVVSEFRALRASVLRLWMEGHGPFTEADMNDLMRFNEAIDQALAESTGRFQREYNAARGMFLAMLGQDLRTPLGAVLIASHFMLKSSDMTDAQRPLVTRIEQSATSIDQLIVDLLDFTRVTLGNGIAIVRKEGNLETEISAAIKETILGHPDAIIELETTGNLEGEWDHIRIHQVLINLLSGAVQHGAASPIAVSAHGEAEHVVFALHNRGPVIPQALLPELFVPFKRLQAAEADPWAGRNFGLSLYIAERIVTAHGGTIQAVSSEESGTTFTVRLPRVSVDYVQRFSQQRAGLP